MNEIINVRLLNDNGDMLWEALLTYTQTKGVLRGAYILIPNIQENLIIEIIISNGEPIYITKNNIEIINNHDIPIYQNISKADLYNYIAPISKYAWWVQSLSSQSLSSLSSQSLSSQSSQFINSQTYDMCVFTNYEYVDGFIKMCELFKVDFRDYTIGSPFILIDNKNFELGISGFDIEPLKTDYSRPASEMPYYTGVHEDDIDGIDFV